MSSTLRKEEIIPRTLTALALVSSFIWLNWFQENVVGFSSETKNGITHVVAGSSPVVFFVSILGIALFIFLMTKEAHIETSHPSSLKRRSAAFIFDCWFLLLTVVGVSSLLHLLLEAQCSGTFRWRYEIENGGAPDGADAAIVLINLIVMLMYFVVPLAHRRQTVGQWLLRLATVDAGENVLYLPFPTALWRTFMAFRGLVSPWRFLKETDAQGRTWYDRETGFTVVRF
jgi:hypothetical protein